MTLASLDDMQAFKDVDRNSAIAALCLSAADEWIKGCLGRAVEPGTFKERHNGGSGLLWPRNWPVTSVTMLTVAGQAWRVLSQDSEEDQNEEALLSPGGIWIESRVSGGFPEGVGNVYLAYNGGYVSIPSKLKLVTIEVAHLCYLERSRLGDQQRSSGAVHVNEYVRGAKSYPFIVETLSQFCLFGQVKTP